VSSGIDRFQANLTLYFLFALAPPFHQQEVQSLGGWQLAPNEPQYYLRGDC